jgi:hypothetical protein
VTKERVVAEPKVFRARSLLRRHDLTVVGGLILVAIGLGVSLLVLQLLIAERPLLAAATVLLGLGAILTAFKVNRIAVASATLLKEYRRAAARGQAGFSSGPAETAGALSGTPGEALGSGIAARPVPGGAIEASEVQPLDGLNKGRSAAAVTSDGWRPHKLLAATLAMGSVATSGAEGPQDCRRIAGVMSPEVSRVLKTRYAVTHLRPDLVAAQLEQAQPSAIVLEESALDQDLWFGGLRASGGSLFREIEGIFDWAKASQQSIYVLPDRTPRPYTAAVRERATFLIRPGLTVRGADPDVELALLESLVATVSGSDRRIETSPEGGTPVGS